MIMFVVGRDARMFVRIKNSHGYKYLQIVENRREGNKVKQRVLTTLGQFDALTESGKIDDLTRSLAKFASTRTIIDAHREGALQARRTLSIGPALVFERLWQQLGIKESIKEEQSASRCRFPLERAIFLTVLHRLVDPGSDRAAERWKEDFHISGTEGIELHHLYRAMGWLGEQSLQLGHDAEPAMQKGPHRREAFRPQSRSVQRTGTRVLRHHQPLLRGARRGEPGTVRAQQGPQARPETDGSRAVLDGTGRPICCEMSPGNLTVVTSLIPVVKRLKSRFGIASVCVVADRGMTSAETI